MIDKKNDLSTAQNPCLSVSVRGVNRTAPDGLVNNPIQEIGTPCRCFLVYL